MAGHAPKVWTVLGAVARATEIAEAVFTDPALAQIGGAPQHQQPFLDYSRDNLLLALRAEFTAGRP